MAGPHGRPPAPRGPAPGPSAISRRTPRGQELAACEVVAGGGDRRRPYRPHKCRGLRQVHGLRRPCRMCRLDAVANSIGFGACAEPMACADSPCCAPATWPSRAPMSAPTPSPARTPCPSRLHGLRAFAADGLRRSHGLPQHHVQAMRSTQSMASARPIVSARAMGAVTASVRAMKSEPRSGRARN